MVFNRIALLCLWGVLDLAVSSFYPWNAYYQNNPMSMTGPMQGSGYNKFSTCFYINLLSPIPVTQQTPMLSYLAGDSMSSEIVVQLEYKRQMSLFIGGGNGAYFPMVSPLNQWTHVCFTWNSYLGLVNAYIDGVAIGAANDVQTGYQIPGQGFWNIGQAQLDSGEITHLQIWDRIISTDEVQQALQCSLYGNVLSWDLPQLKSKGLTMPATPYGHWPFPCKPTVKSCPKHATTSPLDVDDLDIGKGNYQVEGVFNEKLPQQRKISFCSWMYCEKGAEVDPLGIYNEYNLEIFGIFVHGNGSLSVLAVEAGKHEQRIIPNLKIKPYSWEHYCITWSRQNGETQVFVNGKLEFVWNDFMTGYILPAGNKLRVKQLQYNNTDDNNPINGFALKITDINWWDRVITKDEVSQVYSCSGSLPGNIFSWNTDKLEIYNLRQEEGEIVTEGYECLGPVTTSFMDSLNASAFAIGKECKVTSEQVGVNSRMENVSFCLWSFLSSSARNKEYMLISTRAIEEDGGVYDLFMVDQGMVFTYASNGWNIGFTPQKNMWYHMCLSFEVTSGAIRFYLNGEFLSNYTFRAGTGVATSKGELTQNQRRAFDKNKPTTGFLTKVTASNVWDYAITDDIVHEAYCGKAMGNIINKTTKFAELYCELISCPKHAETSSLDMNDLDVEKGTYKVEGVVNKKLPQQSRASFCAWLYCEKGAEVDPLGMYNEDNWELFGIFIHGNGSLSLQVGKAENHTEQIIPNLKTKPYNWDHYCVTWSGQNGETQIFVNGELKYALNDFMTSYTLPAGSKLRVKQLQYNNTDINNTTKGFGLKITDINWWDRVITKDEVSEEYSCSGSLSGNVFSWNEEKLEFSEICQEWSSTSPLDSDNLNVGTGTYKVVGVFNRKPTQQNQVSFCAWLYIEKAADSDPLSVYDEDDEELIGVFLHRDGSLGLQMGAAKTREELAIPKLQIEPRKWDHYCITWSAEDGKTQVFLNSYLKFMLRDFMTGYSLPEGSKLRVTQLQYDNVASSDPTKGFALKITDVNWWDHVLTENEVAQVYSCSGSLPGNVFSWNNDKLKFYETCRVPETTSYMDSMNETEIYSGRKCDAAAVQNGQNAQLNDFSICAWTFLSSDACPDHTTLLEVEFTQNSGDRFAIKMTKRGILFDLNNYWVIDFDRQRNSWYHTCFTFESSSGTIQFYLNGKFHSKKTEFQTGVVIASSSFGWWQIQTELYNETEPTKGFHIKVTAPNVWDFVIKEDIVYDVYCGKARGNIVNKDTEFIYLHCS